MDYFTLSNFVKSFFLLFESFGFDCVIFFVFLIYLFFCRNRIAFGCHFYFLLQIILYDAQCTKKNVSKYKMELKKNVVL